jgi:hypothetical protein
MSSWKITAITFNRTLFAGITCVLGVLSTSQVHALVKPEPWTSSDVGSVGLKGSSYFNPTNGLYVVKGSGSPISTRRPGLHFVSGPLSSDFRITVRVKDVQNEDVYGAGGILIRQTLSTNVSKRVFLGLTAGKKVVFGNRFDPSPDPYFGTSVKSPQWLRLVRQSGWLTAYRSDDGRNWHWVGSLWAWMNSPFHGGIAVTSHKQSTLCTALFDRVRLELDQDNDGLYDGEEAAAGTDPRKFDTDGDGHSDFAEIRQLFSDPLKKDVQASTVKWHPGASATIVSGDWEKGEKGSLISKSRRGSLEYVVTIPQDDVYQFEFKGRSTWDSGRTLRYPFTAYIDGERITEFTISSYRQGTGTARFITPWLKAGTHKVRFDWENAEMPRSFTVLSFVVRSLTGTDADNDGVKDWVEKRLANDNAITRFSSSSLTSPACVEGITSHFGSLSISGGIGKRPGIGSGWYANVPLTAGKKRYFTVTFENGAYSQTRGISWKPTNILKHEDLTIRLGDSILLAVQPEGITAGSVQIKVGDKIYGSKVSVPVPHKFSEAGEFEVEGTFLGVPNQSRKLKVKVVKAGFSSTPVALTGFVRYWTCRSLPKEVVVEADPRIAFQEIPASGSKRVFGIKIDKAEPRYVVARLSKNGPILANRLVEGVGFHSSDKTNTEVVKRLSDGSRRVVMGVVVTKPVKDLRIRYEVLSAGTVFEDGTRKLELTEADFDELREANAYFIVPKGPRMKICHVVKVYQGDQLIGSY